MLTTRVLAFRVAQVFGIGGAFWLSGNIAALSLISIPALLTSQAQDSASSATILRQWRYNYELGKLQNPKVATVTAGSLFYLAWSVRRGFPLASRPASATTNMRLYMTGAVLVLAMIPYTLLVMKDTNRRLIAMSDAVRNTAVAAKEDNQHEVARLLGNWGLMNSTRSVLPGLGGVAAVIAALL